MLPRPRPWKEVSGGLVASPFPGITTGTWCIQVPSGGRKQFRGGAQEVNTNFFFHHCKKLKHKKKTEQKNTNTQSRKLTAFCSQFTTLAKTRSTPFVTILAHVAVNTIQKHFITI